MRPPAIPPSTSAPADTLVSRVRDQVQRCPEQTVLRFLGDEDGVEVCWTYAEVDRRAKAVAAQLQAAGAVGQRALILHAPGPEYVAALLGCFYAGTVAVPAYPPTNRGLARLRAMVADAGARFALSAARAIDKMGVHFRGEPQLAALTWLASDEAPDRAGTDWRAPAPERGAVALLQYTSGSTSAPKGVALSHGNFLDNIQALWSLRGAERHDRIVSWLPPFHDMGLVCGILMPLCTGIPSTLLAPSAFLQRPLRWLSAIGHYGGTISGGPNFAFELCVRRIADPAQLRALDLSGWQVAFCGAERVRADTLERFAAAFAPAGFRRTALTPCYGLAEATVAVSFAQLGLGPRVLRVDERALGQNRVAEARADEPAQTLVSCGAPVPGCHVRIVDPTELRPLGPDEVGEIWVQSPSVAAAGYWGNAELSASVFGARLADAAGGDFLRTGDLGFCHGGELFVAGRIKDLIVLRGVNHYPEDIEGTVQNCHPLLRTGGGAAFAVDEQGEERLVIVHEVEDARSAPLDDIAAAIRNSVAEAHEIAVREIVLVARGAVPRTSSGKVQRALCREQYLGGQLKLLARAAPLAQAPAPVPAELVARVGRLMADLLGLPSVEAADDFFWLGGHSLMATQLVSRLRDTFAVDLPLRAVFEAPTPRQLAARIAVAPPMTRLPPIEPVDRNRRTLRLSFSQERMWLLHHLDPQSAAYNVAGGLAFEGPLDLDALRLALDEIVKRHEVLRTNFPAVDGEPQVRIRAPTRLALAFMDVSGRADPSAEAMRAATRLARAPFDIAAEPLLRVALYRLGPAQHLLCVSMHHLVTDAWSIGLLVADLLRCYDAFAARRVPAPLAQPLTYVDYAYWQREILTDEHLAGQLAFWKRQLEGAKPVELPSDRPRSLRRSSAGAYHAFALPRELLDALATLGAARGATLFMVLLAGFEALLYRYTNAADLVVGIPVANRNQLASEALMGSLVNTLALRLQFAEDASFATLLGAVREATLDAYAHQDLPFERLVSALPVERRLGESPIVSVMFDFQNAPVPGRADGPLRVRPVMLPRDAAQFDLLLHIFSTELGRLAGFEYSTELFDAAAIGRMAGHYVAILESVLINPDLPISRIGLLSSAERTALLARAVSDSRAAGAASPVPEAFAEQVRRVPQAGALVDEGGILSYAALDALAAGLAARLRALGAGPGERVAVCLTRDRQLVAALLAVLRTGAAYVPLDPGHPADRLAYTLRDAQPRVVLSSRPLRGVLPAVGCPPCLFVDDVDDGTEAPATPAAEPALGDVPAHAPADPAAYVIYTSGSTGQPKGVEVSGAALANFLRSMSRRPGIGPGDRLLSVTTVAFDIAGLELWLPLVNGASVRLVPGELVADARALLERMRQWRPTLMQATPATWKMLLEAGWQGDPALKVLCGGEAFPPELAAALLERCQSVWNLYGPTETTVWSTVHHVQRGDGPRIPIGAPIEATRVYLLDRHGELQPWGVAGEIYIGGAGVANGYFRRPELTAERFVPDPFVSDAPAGGPAARMYRTGDAGRLRADGALECLARLDDQIKVRGFRIEPGEIEAALKDDARIRDAVVVAREAAPGDVRLVAYYVVAPAHAQSPPAAAQLMEPLQRRLPAYMIPSAFVVLAALPKTPNGKIDRQRLPAPQFPGRSPDDTYVAARDELETALVQMWENVLGVGHVGVRDSFFELGGHSLLAVRIFARIEKRFGAVLPLATLFERPTIEYLAERIRQVLRPRAPGRTPLRGSGANARRFSFLVPIQEQGTRPALFCVHGAGGHVFNFSNLARQLGAEHPMYGFQAKGVDGRAAPFAHIEQMAEAYIKELRVLQPEGPYYLSGYCGGGIIAFEMARALQRAGQAVALLALIDCYRPGIHPGAPRHQRWALGFRQEGLVYLWRKAGPWLARQHHQISSWLRVGYYRVLGRTVPFELRDFWLTQHFLQAANAYRPLRYSGKLTILRAMEVDSDLLGVGPELGWSDLAAGGIQSFDIPGDHYSLLQEPNIGVLGAALKSCLETAEGSLAP